MKASNDALPRIVIVGGGAGGLELATKLGRTLGKQKRAEIMLIDCARTHVWKPLLHEVAAGTLDVNDDELDYLAQAHANHFRFNLGRMTGLNRKDKRVQLAPMIDAHGVEIIPARSHHYELLVIAVGSICNDFGIPGVAENCLFLDSTGQAEQFQTRLLEAYTRAHVQGGVKHPGQLDVAIVGGGATGIELSAQLHQATRLLSAYGLDKVEPSDIKIHLIEASPHLLPGLPERLAAATEEQLRKLGVDLRLSEKVVEVTPEGVKTAAGHLIPAAIKVWAAGIKAPDFLKTTDLEINRINQIVVRRTLQSTVDDSVFALGDCCACPWPEKDRNVPPRAQSAHQQASLLVKNLSRQLEGQPLLDYHYTDYGSLVALGKFSTVGNLMGNLLGSVMVEGLMARFVYLSLYKMHQLALFGPFRVGMLMIANFFSSRLRPKIKLH